MRRVLPYAGQLRAISRGAWMTVAGLILAAPTIAQTGTSPWENAVSVLQQGEQLFPRKWNHEFIDMPVVEKSKQNTPHFTSEVIAGILARTKGYKQMFCALLAGTGLRAGEAIGLEIDKHISEDFRTLYIRQKVRRTKLEFFLKTDAGRRDVDLCPKLAALLKA